jgi:hypothetical protein
VSLRRLFAAVLLLAPVLINAGSAHAEGWCPPQGGLCAAAAISVSQTSTPQIGGGGITSSTSNSSPYNYESLWTRSFNIHGTPDPYSPPAPLYVTPEPITTLDFPIYNALPIELKGRKLTLGSSCEQYAHEIFVNPDPAVTYWEEALIVNDQDNNFVDAVGWCWKTGGSVGGTPPPPAPPSPQSLYDAAVASVNKPVLTVSPQTQAIVGMYIKMTVTAPARITATAGDPALCSATADAHPVRYEWIVDSDTNDMIVTSADTPADATLAVGKNELVAYDKRGKHNVQAAVVYDGTYTINCGGVTSTRPLGPAAFASAIQNFSVSEAKSVLQ